MSCTQITSVSTLSFLKRSFNNFLLVVSCTIWKNHEIKKADLSVLDISSTIISKVESMPNNMDYFYLGAALSVLLALIPALCRLCNLATDDSTNSDVQLSVWEISHFLLRKVIGLFVILESMFGNTYM